MAPDQLAGKGATVRSDMYSLGLVLYEIYTGKKAFTAATLAELREQKETHTPRAISEMREGMDPVVERLIRRCMERDPNARPASAAQLALALPGGDPLAAAIAAGETPSPEMVAASGSQEGLRPAVAWGLLAFIIVGFLAALAMKDRIFLHRRMPFEKPPYLLVERSREIIKKAGYTDSFADSAYGLMENTDLLNYIEKSDEAANRAKKLDAKAILFWYRQSPRQFQVRSGSIAPDNPPLQYSGEVSVLLDTEGHLVSFRIVPSKVQSKTGTTPPPVWTLLFEEAGLDISLWKQAEAQQIPDSYADDRAAWEGSLRSFPNAQARIEAASFQGKPVSFAITGPWALSAQKESKQRPLSERIVILGYTLVVVPAIGGGIMFARRNMRLGRGDRRNANRIALFVLSLSVLKWIFQPQVSFVNLLLTPYLAVLVWIFYMAIEPFVRRRWPQVLVSWTRLLSGESRDPLVARDTLIGCALGVFGGCISVYGSLLPSRFFAGQNLPHSDIDSFMGVRFAISNLLYSVLLMIFISLATFCLLVILRILLRSQKAAITVCAAFMVMASYANYGFAAALIGSALWFFVLMRFGLIAATFLLFASISIRQLPTTLESSAWYAGYGYLALAILAAIVLYAFRTSLGGRPLLAPSRLDD
jgi:serine/threonine-protein kinase